MPAPAAAPGRIVILSDTHMARPGRGAGSAEALRPLWAGASRVIFNGDTAETRSQRRYDQSMRRIDDLKRLAAADDVELTIIAGNHDPLVSDLDWVELAGGAVLVTHGDLLHPAIAPWADENNELETEYRRALAELKETPDSADLRDKADAAKRASARHWRKQLTQRYQQSSRGPWRRWLIHFRKVALVLYYWTAMPRRAMRFADEHFPDCRFFVFGHIHRPGVWRDASAEVKNVAEDFRGRGPFRGPFRGRVILNTGSFYMPRRPRAVVIEAGEISLYKIHFDRKHGHRLAPRPMRTFPLEYTPAESS